VNAIACRATHNENRRFGPGDWAFTALKFLETREVRCGR
jgi:hypothetical protein